MRGGPAARVALLGLAPALAGGIFDAEPLYAPGLALLLLAILVPAWVHLAARRAGVARTVEARRVLEGEPVEALIDGSMGAGLPSPGGLIRDPLLPDGLPP